MHTNIARIFILLALTVGLAACSSTKPKPVAPIPAETTAMKVPEPEPEPAGLKAVYNGEELPFKTFIVYSYGGAGLRGELSTHTPVCSDFEGGGRGLAEGEKYISFAIAPQLSPEGLTDFQIISFNFDFHGQLDSKDGIQVQAGDKPEDLSVTFDIQQEWKENAFLKRPAGSLSMTGTLAPTHCGTVAKDKDATARPQDKLKLRFGAHEVPVQGASVVWKEDEILVRLTSQPHSCLIDNIGTDASIVLTMDRKAWTPTAMVVTGDLFANATINYGMEAADGKATLHGAPTDDGQGMDIAINKASDIPIQIEGSLVAEICD